VSALEGRTAEGKSFDINKDPVGFATTAAADLLMPMSLQDLPGLVRENPAFGAMLIPLMMLGHGVSTSRGAKESWLGSGLTAESRERHKKTTLLEKELRRVGVAGPRLSHRITLPGKDILGRNLAYNMTPGEVKEFEAAFMPAITDLLVQFINSEYYKNLPESRKPKAMQARVSALNKRYGAATRLKQQYRQLYREGKIKPSNLLAEDVVKRLEAEEQSPRTLTRGKGEAF
jgi:hypothetical protein